MLRWSLNQVEFYVYHCFLSCPDGCSVKEKTRHFLLSISLRTRVSLKLCGLSWWPLDYDMERSGLSGISVIDGTIFLFLIPAPALCL